MTIPKIEALLIEAGEWAQANGISLLGNGFGVEFLNDRWRQDISTDGICVLGALLIKAQPNPRQSLCEASGSLLGIGAHEAQAIGFGFDGLFAKDPWYALGNRLRARFISAA